MSFYTYNPALKLTCAESHPSLGTKKLSHVFIVSMGKLRHGRTDVDRESRFLLWERSLASSPSIRLSTEILGGLVCPSVTTEIHDQLIRQTDFWPAITPQAKGAGRLPFRGFTWRSQEPATGQRVCPSARSSVKSKGHEVLLTGGSDFLPL